MTPGTRVILTKDLETVKAGIHGTISDRKSDDADNTPGIEWDYQKGVIHFRDRIDEKIIKVIDYVEEIPL